MEVTIMGQSYILACPEGREAAMLAAVAQVDREMSTIRDGGKVKARERIAVLAALNLAFSPSERPVAASTSTAWSTASTWHSEQTANCSDASFADPMAA
jgi:cell division protein ZapA